MVAPISQAQELVLKHRGLVPWVIRRRHYHDWAKKLGIDQGELNDEGVLHLVRAAYAYQADARVAFTTFAEGRIRSGLYSYLARQRRVSQLPLIGEDGAEMDVPARPEKDVGIAADVQRLLRVVPERLRQVVEARFGLVDGRERTLEEIGLEIGVSRERARQLVESALGRLRSQVNDVEIFENRAHAI